MNLTNDNECIFLIKELYVSNEEADQPFIDHRGALLNAVERSVHLHGLSPLPVVNLLSYHSASSPATRQPKRIRLLSDVDVFWRTISLLSMLVTN